MSARARAADWKRRGHAREAEGSPAALADALRCYDEGLALLREAEEPRARRDAGVLWMNRGNALQRLGGPRLAEAVEAYDRAIALLSGLDPAADAGLRNSLGAAWMNRGDALHRRGGPDALAEAARSQEQAVALLRTLPLEEEPDFRLNLAGAWVDLANVRLDQSEAALAPFARAAAAEALAVVAPAEESGVAFAAMGLRARRALCDALGQMLFAETARGRPAAALAAEAADAVDDGLALARRRRDPDGPILRPLALRLFRFGARLCALHQPHFLSEFLLENLDPAARPGAFAGDADFLAAATEALALARAGLAGPRLLVAGDPAAERLVLLSRDLSALERRLQELRG